LENLQIRRDYKIEGIQHQQKNRTKGLRILPKSELNVKNKITETHASGDPVLKGSFGIINWRPEKIQVTGN
jgi:hypothetical protein